MSYITSKIKLKPGYIPEDVKQEIRDMRDEGLSYNNIAWYIGVSSTTVYAICNRERYNARHMDYMKKLPADRKELIRKKNLDYYYKTKSKIVERYDY